MNPIGNITDKRILYEITGIKSGTDTGNWETYSAEDEGEIPVGRDSEDPDSYLLGKNEDKSIN